MANRYNTANAEPFGISVVSGLPADFSFRRGTGPSGPTQYIGTSEQLIAAGLAAPGDFPEGRKRYGRWHNDEYGNSLQVERRRGGQFALRVWWDHRYLAWLEKQTLVNTWIAVMPTTEDEYREHLRRSLASTIERFARFHLKYPEGGFQIVGVDDDVNAIVDAALTFIDSAPVRYSQHARDEQVKQYRSEADRLNPRFRAFVEGVVNAAVPLAVEGAEE